MHRVLLIREILLEIFGHFSSTSRLGGRADLSALARTCHTFKEPALDVLWETLSDLSPLILCLPEACKIDETYYSFSRPLSDAEWNTLRGYTRRVRSIHKSDAFDRRTIVLPQVQAFTEPLFPNLRSLLWEPFKALPVKHISVPSLISLSLGLYVVSEHSLVTEALDIIGERCPNIRQFYLFSFGTGPLLDEMISRQLCRWSDLRCADCRTVTLTMDFIFHLPSLFILDCLSFTLSADLGNYATPPGSVFILASLVKLNIKSTSLKSVTTFFSRIQLPKIKDLDISVSEYTPQWHVRQYWTTVQRACPSNTLSRLVFSSIETLPGLDEQRRPCLTLHDLLPYKDFGNLRKIEIDIAWSVNLTDADILDLVSTSPQLEELYINNQWGWGMSGEGGITLSGLVQLLRQCPSLHTACFAIDIRTFTLDVSFLPRPTYPGTLTLNCLDSREFNPVCESVFKALKLSVTHEVGKHYFRI